MSLRRIAFVDHSYHKKTRSTFFIREALFPGAVVEDWWDESWRGGSPVDVGLILAQNYDMVAVCQVELAAEALARANFRNAAFIPMWDGCRFLPESWWKALEGFRIVSFSRALHERVRAYGLMSINVQYYPDPSYLPEVTDFTTLRGFFWQRHRELTWQHVLRLAGDVDLSSLHIHMAQDPQTQAVKQPSRAEREKHGITASSWFERQSDYLDTLTRTNVYFAPRLSEGIGFSFLEAMAMGMCVVAPNAPTMSEYITDQVSGLLWDPTAPVPLDFSKAGELGRRARRKVRAGHQIWLTQIPALQEFVAAPARTAGALCEALRFRGGTTKAISQRVAERIPFTMGAQAAVPVSRGGLRETGVERRDGSAPLVTVATVTYDCIDAFEGTIRNILRQDYPNLEIIVLDGGSTDGTLDLIRRYDDCVDLWLTEPDNGPYDAMTKAADLARGRFIIFMNAGDWFFGESAISRAMLDVPEEADFIIGHHIYRRIDGTEILRKAADFETTWRNLVSGKLSNSWLDGIPCHQATFTRTQMLREGRYDPRFRIAADHEFLCRQRSLGAKVHNCDSIVAVYCDGGFSAKNALRCLDEWTEIVTRYGSAQAAQEYFGAGRAVIVEEHRPEAEDRNLEALSGGVHHLRMVEREVERLRAIENSFSWKLTLPLRQAVDRMPGAARRLRWLRKVIQRFLQ